MPARLLIEGGVPLRGEVAASAAKNAALPALAAALLTARPLTLTNVPDLGDVRTMLKLLRDARRHGAASRPRGHVTVENVASDLAPYELVSTMRASVLVLGPLVARYGSARVALPGGCAIGVRPIDQHLKGLAKLGAEIAIENGYVVARASRLKAARIATDLVTVTGTENLMMAAALAEGTTIIENAAREPEVSDLGALLTAMGARLHGVGTGRIEIEGVPELTGSGPQGRPGSHRGRHAAGGRRHHARRRAGDRHGPRPRGRGARQARGVRRGARDRADVGARAGAAIGRGRPTS